MHFKTHRWMIAALAIGGGCGGRTGPEIVPATGSVYWHDQPLAGARVIFNPLNGRPAQGTTDADGRFRLSTLQAGDGAVVGRHRVAVIGKRERVEAMPGDAPSPAASAAAVELPAQYASPQTSGLEYTVSDGAKNDFQLRLE